jgi:Protein of unknown function (DUF2505)
MKLTHSVRYDASVADVRAMLADAAFRDRATWAQGATSVEVTVAGGSVRIDMASPNTDVPAFARKIAGDSVHAIQAEEWSGDEADLSITTPKVPAGIQGQRTLVADGDGCLDTFDGEAKARIPVVSGKIEKLIADKLKKRWDVEHGVGVAWLDGDR